MKIPPQVCCLEAGKSNHAERHCMTEGFLTPDERVFFKNFVFEMIAEAIGEKFWFDGEKFTQKGKEEEISESIMRIIIVKLYQEKRYADNANSGNTKEGASESEIKDWENTFNFADQSMITPDEIDLVLEYAKAESFDASAWIDRLDM